MGPMTIVGTAMAMAMSGDGGRRAGELEDDDEQGEVGEAVAGLGDELAEPQPAVVRDAQDVAGAWQGGGRAESVIG